MDQNKLYKVGEVVYFKGILYQTSDLCGTTRNNGDTVCCYELNNQFEQTGQLEWILVKDIIDIIPKPYKVGSVLYIDNDNGLDIVSFKFNNILKNWLYILENGDLTTHDNIINQGGKLYFTEGLLTKYNHNQELNTQANNNKSDNVNQPSHYTTGGIETIDFIQAKLGKEGFIAYCIGNVMKYITRYQHKNGIEDLKKAMVYLGWAVETMEDENK